jgi:hypothetical protein
MLDWIIAFLLFGVGKSIDKHNRMTQVDEPKYEEPLVVGCPDITTESRCKTYLKAGESWEDLA